MTDSLQTEIERLLGKPIINFSLKGKGACNNAYYFETAEGGKYIAKQERPDKETYEQNDVITEGTVIKRLAETGLNIALPHVVFMSPELKMYGYEFIEGEMLRSLWSSLTHEERIAICTALGIFHAEIGKRFTKEMSEEIGIMIDSATGLHPEVLAEYQRLVVDERVPDDVRSLAKEAKDIFDASEHEAVFQFIHNDAHHENILIKDKQISGIIDFGDAEYGEMSREFSRYIRDFPDYFPHIVGAYEKASGNTLSRKRLVSNSFISDLPDVMGKYNKGGDDQVRAITAIETYRRLITEAAQ